MMVMSAKMEDKIFDEMGIEGEQINAGVQKLMEAKDPEFMEVF